MPSLYFSERENGEQPRNNETINQRVWNAIKVKKDALINDGSFGKSYPDPCPDGGSDPIGTDEGAFDWAMRAEIPALAAYYEEVDNKKGSLDFIDEDLPPISVILDMIEFCWRNVSKPSNIPNSYHAFFNHHHLKFDVEAGRRDFCEWVNTIFRRNGLVYELKRNGKVERLVSTALQNILNSRLRTGDAELDKMLATAEEKIINHRIEVQSEALVSLWAAWERLKPIYDPHGDKKKGVTSLLNIAAGDNSPKFREMLEEEAKALTDVGNSFRIRHSEPDREKIVKSKHAEYLFHRMFALIHLIIGARNQGH